MEWDKLEEFLASAQTATDETEIDPDIRDVLEKIWAQNDGLTAKRGPGYITKGAALKFLRSQGIKCHEGHITRWARQCGRFSWSQK